MENDLISRSALKKFIQDGLNCKDPAKAFGHDAIEILAEIEFAPAVDAVSRAAVDQIRFERDCAMQQLNDHNIPFGGYAPNVVEVVRCKDCVCWMYEYDDVGLCVTDVAPVDDGIDGVQRLAMDFCSYGERRADDGK